MVCLSCTSICVKRSSTLKALTKITSHGDVSDLVVSTLSFAVDAAGFLFCTVVFKVSCSELWTIGWCFVSQIRDLW